MIRNLQIRSLLGKSAVALAMAGPLVGYLVGSAGAAVDCNSQNPAVAHCGVESKCENINAGGFTCLNSTGWYFQPAAYTTCVGATPNDNCHDDGTNKALCACKFRCTDPDPATGKCAKGRPFKVDDGQGNMIQQCTDKVKKKAFATCTVSG